MKVNQYPMIGLVCISILAGNAVQSARIVHDPISAKQSARQWGEQIKKWEEDLKRYNAYIKLIKGEKKYGLIAEQIASNFLPTQWNDYMPTSTPDLVHTRGINENKSAFLLKNFSLMVNTFNESKVRLERINNIINEINHTTGPKEAEDLNNRLQAEILLMQESQNRLHSMQQIMSSEKELASHQKWLEDKCYAAFKAKKSNPRMTIPAECAYDKPSKARQGQAHMTGKSTRAISLPGTDDSWQLGENADNNQQVQNTRLATNNTKTPTIPNTVLATPPFLPENNKEANPIKVSENNKKDSLLQNDIQASNKTGQADTNTATTKQKKEVISEKTFNEIFSGVKKDRAQEVSEAVNQYGEPFLTNQKRKAHYLGQVLTEVGAAATFVESTCYRNSKIGRLGMTGFIYYQKHPKEIDQDLAIPYPEKCQVIANKAYGMFAKPELGNDKPGDGYKYRGRGLIQLTGKHNYAEFTKWYNKRQKDDPRDFVNNPELLETPKYATISSLYYWATNGLLKEADKGVSNKVINDITCKINCGTDEKNKAKRRENVKKVLRILQKNKK